MELQHKKIYELSTIIQDDWRNPYFGAVPYLEAMMALDDIKDSFGSDSGHGIVLYFLSNASTWRGPVAREVKAELKRRLAQ